MSQSMQVTMVRVSDHTLESISSSECDPLMILIAAEEQEDADCTSSCHQFNCTEHCAKSGYGECTLTIEHTPITFTR